MKKQVFMLVLFASVILLSQNVYAVFAPSNGALKDRNGNPMRGTPMVLGKSLPNSVRFATNIKNWKFLQNCGYNTVRLCWVDPYYKDRSRDFWSVNEVVPYLDQVVENATKTGMNLIINLHNVGAQQNYDKSYEFSLEKEFWKAVAPRYKTNPLVYYEPANEPTFRMNDYTKPEYMRSYLELYNIIRTLAPEREVLLFSFNTIAEPILNVVREYDDKIDWNHTSVAYHMYNSETSKSVTSIMENHKVICTEWWYDHRKPGNDYIKSVDGFKQNAQTLEKIGSGWTDWRDWGDTTLNEVIDTLIKDARQKGYWWGKPVQGLKATGISISDNIVTLASGSAKKLCAFPLPAQAENQKILWTSSDRNLVKVDKNGLVTASKGTGKAEIIATTGDRKFSAKCVVNVGNSK